MLYAEILICSDDFCLIWLLSDSLNHSFFGLNETSEEELDTFFFRIRGVDDVGNKADWSNELSASFFDPAEFEAEQVSAFLFEHTSPNQFLKTLG